MLTIIEFLDTLEDGKLKDKIIHFFIQILQTCDKPKTIKINHFRQIVREEQSIMIIKINSDKFFFLDDIYESQSVSLTSSNGASKPPTSSGSTGIIIY